MEGGVDCFEPANCRKLRAIRANGQYRLSRGTVEESVSENSHECRISMLARKHRLLRVLISSAVGQEGDVVGASSGVFEQF